MSVSEFEAIGASVGALVDRKQIEYGDSFGRSGGIMRILYPDGIAEYQLDDALTVVRVIDKLFRIAQRGHDGQDLGGESPWSDIAGYAILSLRRERKHL